LISGINIRTPVTGIIGTEEFDIFLEINKLYDTIYNEESYDRIKELFISGNLVITWKRSSGFFSSWLNGLLQ
jgi:hypothetical protein